MTQFRPTPFESLTPVVKSLLIINVLFFIAQNTIGAPNLGNMDELFGLHQLRSPLFQPWQIITHMFMHANGWHIFGNMFALWMFGSVLEGLWGPRRFLMFYMVCGIGAGLIHVTYQWYELNPLINDFIRLKTDHSSGKMLAFLESFLDKYPTFFKRTGGDKIYNNIKNYSSDPAVISQGLAYIKDVTNAKLGIVTMGASGAVYGLIAAFIYLFPNTTFLLGLLFPIKAKWMALIYFVPTVIGAFSPSEGDNIAHWAHLGGGLVGFLLVLTWNRNNRRNFY